MAATKTELFCDAENRKNRRSREFLFRAEIKMACFHRPYAGSNAVRDVGNSRADGATRKTLLRRRFRGTILVRRTQRSADQNRQVRSCRLVRGRVLGLNCRAVMQRTPRIEIEYCTQCRWLLRAAWMAQELLPTFSADIGEIALMPGSGGVFEIRIGDDAVWSRAEKGRFPEIKELKQLVRDRIAPGKDLGHSEVGHSREP